MDTRLEPSIAGRLGKGVRVGCVSFINSKPLIYGLQEQGVPMELAVPSGLLQGLRDGAYDVALLPVIDYQRMDGLRIIPASGIGCDGPTLTVRIFSRIPIQQVRTLACDTDSHTSVALARVILAERFGIRPELTELVRGGSRQPEAMLLIGDKVVCEEPEGYPHQVDLGEEWKHMTGLPFVFAVWMARAKVDVGDLPVRLEQAKRNGLAHVRQIVEQYAVPRGWPEDIALRYLTEYLKFDIGDRQLQAIALFHQLAAKYQIIPSPVRPLEVIGREWGR